MPECISASNSSSSSNPDHVRDLNNFLQGFKDADGNFTRYLSWLMKHDGPDNQKTHYATARFRGQDIGYGRGFSKGNAKQEAANQALEYLSNLPANDDLLSTQQA